MPRHSDRAIKLFPSPPYTMQPRRETARTRTLSPQKFRAGEGKSCRQRPSRAPRGTDAAQTPLQREFLSDNLLVRISRLSIIFLMSEVPL